MFILSVPIYSITIYYLLFNYLIQFNVIDHCIKIQHTRTVYLKFDGQKRKLIVQNVKKTLMMIT